MSSNQVPITREKYMEIEAEIDKLKEDSKKLSTAISAARDLGDLSENAEYHAAREQKAMVEAKISNLKGKLATYEIVDKEKINTDSVQFGTKVVMYDQTFDEELEYRIVGEGQGNNDSEISVNSPVGRSLLNKKVGEIVEVRVPNGTIKYKILKISL